MKKSGMTFVETLIVFAVCAPIIIGTALVLRMSINAVSAANGLEEMTSKARNFLAGVVNNISSSADNYINMVPCVNECLGQKLLYKEVVEDQTPIAGTAFSPDGKLKFGADGKQYCFWIYMVNMQDQLVRTIQCNSELQDCGTDGTCAGGENVNNCPLDCGSCGDNVCSQEISENVGNCPQDCRGCGDRICGPGEACTGVSPCPQDCVENGLCSQGMWEW